MAKINLLVKTKKDPVELYVRLFYTLNKERNDLFAKSGINLKSKKWWSNKKQNFNAVSEPFPKEKLLNRINKLKDFILNEFNEAFNNGETIDKIWLENIINTFHKRPKNEAENFRVYFIPFVTKFIEESKERINMVTGNKISNRTIQKYNTTLERLKEFETKHNVRLRHKDIGLDFHGKFVSYLSIDGNYGNSSIEKYISQVKTFCREAEVFKCEINPEYKSRRFSFRRQKPLDPYLNLNEIENISNLKIEDKRLDNIRDYLIIGLFTGLRVSDFKQLKRLNIVNNNILIASTKKNIKPVTIPIHSKVQRVLDKRKGELPKIDLSEKAWENEFNKKIKVLCNLAGINEMILGDKRDKETNRDIRSIYPKYELVSSHICRRSFVSNHYGKLPNQAIMAITTHSSEQQLLAYVKIGNETHIETVRKYWEEEEKAKSKLKIVS